MKLVNGDLGHLSLDMKGVGVKDETIKINREMLREAWDRVDYRSRDGDELSQINLEYLEKELFGSSSKSP